MVTKMFDIGIKSPSESHCNPERVWFSFWKPFFFKKVFPFFLCFFLLSWRLIESFHYHQLSLLSFQFSAVRPDHLLQADLQIRPWNQSIRPPYKTIRSAVRPPHPNTTTDHRQTGPPNQIVRTDHHRQTRPPDQTTPPDHRTPFSKQKSTPNPLKWFRSGAFFMGWVKGGI